MLSTTLYHHILQFMQWNAIDVYEYRRPMPTKFGEAGAPVNTSIYRFLFGEGQSQ